MPSRPEAPLVLNSAYLAARRRELGLPVERVALDAGITAGSVQAYERGARQPGLTLLVTLAAVLHCSVADLLHDSAAAAVPA